MADLVLIMMLIVLIFMTIAIASLERTMRDVVTQLKKISTNLSYHDEYTEEELKNAK